MQFIYIDDSSSRPIHIFSALAVPVDRWNDVFERLKSWRKHLYDVHGIRPNYELHANEFVSGRGSGGTLKTLKRHTRAQIFHTSFKVTDWLNECGCTLFNVCHRGDNQERSFERLLNRINRTMQAQNDYAHLVCDEGKEYQYTRLVRKMRVYNPIPSKLGAWADSGEETKNIVLDRIIEDPQFKRSDRSWFIQHVDFMAYGLLAQERPTPKLKKHGAHKSFSVLDKCLQRVCNPRDPQGIIR